MKTDIVSYQVCKCGAITLNTADGGAYSCKRRNLKRFVDVDLRRVERLHDVVCCDHCVNHYGMDLCACGSGETPSRCKGGFDCCGKPMQVFGNRDW